VTFIVFFLYNNSLKNKVYVGCRPSQKKRLFLEEKHARRKGQLEGKEAHVREACEAHM
jgi:hypothetical protein